MKMKLAVAAVAATSAMLLPALPAQAETTTEVKVASLSQVSGLTAQQKAAINAYAAKGTVSVAAARPAKQANARAASSRRAAYYRGSFLMWTRDNVDFGYNFKSVTWTSPFQQHGAVFPNVARNLGISKYYNTVRNDRFRAANRIGAGIVTPWGDVTVYTSDFLHRLSVNYNGAWSAWSD